MPSPCVSCLPFSVVFHQGLSHRCNRCPCSPPTTPTPKPGWLPRLWLRTSAVAGIFRGCRVTLLPASSAAPPSPPRLSTLPVTRGPPTKSLQGHWNLEGRDKAWAYGPIPRCCLSSSQAYLPLACCRCSLAPLWPSYRQGQVASSGLSLLFFCPSFLAD